MLRTCPEWQGKYAAFLKYSGMLKPLAIPQKFLIRRDADIHETA